MVSDLEPHASQILERFCIREIVRMVSDDTMSAVNNHVFRFVQLIFIFGSRPNKASLSVRLYVRPCTKSFSNLNEV